MHKPRYKVAVANIGRGSQRLRVKKAKVHTGRERTTEKQKG